MEFQAIVFCGDGHRLAPIVGEGMPKALLPVANRPLVDYCIEWCEKALFRKITLVCTPTNYDSISQWTNTRASRQGEPVSESGRPSSSTTDSSGSAHDSSSAVGKVPLETVKFDGTTGEALAFLAPRIDTDVVVLPCDFIADLSPESLFAPFRAHNESMLVAGYYYKNTCESIDTKKVLSPDVTLHTPFESDSALLLDAYPRQSIKEAKYLKIRMAMLWKFAQADASTDLLYSGIYIFRHKALEFLIDSDEDNGIDVADKSIHKVVRDLARRSWQHKSRLEDVAMQLLPASTGFLRANNVPMYLEANRNQMKVRARQASQRPAAGASAAAAKEKGAAVIGNDSMVGKDTTVGAKSSLKRTLVGDGCTIGTKCRLTNCVILDHVKLENDITLDNCIIGLKAVVHSKVRLFSCEVEGGYEVPGGFEAKNEQLKGLSMSSLQDEEYADLYESLSESESDDNDDEETDASEEEDEEEFDGDDDFFDRS